MEPRKKIVHIIPTLERGGSEMSQLRMLPLINDKFENVFITLGAHGSLADSFSSVGITVMSLNQKQSWNIIAFFRLKKMLDNIVPDLVITHLLWADFVGRFFVQFFVSCRVVSSLATTYNSPHYLWAQLFERITKSFCSGYIANAEIVKQIYVKKFKVSENKINVLTTGMDIKLFRNQKQDEQLRRVLNILPTDTVIICVANLHPNKGHKFLIDAFEEIYKKHNNIKLLLVGDGDERARLVKQVASCKSKETILFLGKRSDVVKLLSLSHIFVLPTFFEGMCNALMEAMASALAVVTTDIPENRELVIHEKTGLLCPAKDVASLVNSIEYLINNRQFAETIGLNASASIEQKYNLENSALRWESVYYSLIK